MFLNKSYAGSQRIAIRTGAATRNGSSASLSSTTTIADATGNWVGTQLYKAWGYILSIGKKDQGARK
jgi:hypothetical protein